MKIFFVEDFVAEPDMALRGDNFGVFFFRSRKMDGVDPKVVGFKVY